MPPKKKERSSSHNNHWKSSYCSDVYSVCFGLVNVPIINKVDMARIRSWRAVSSGLRRPAASRKYGIKEEGVQSMRSQWVTSNIVCIVNCKSKTEMNWILSSRIFTVSVTSLQFSDAVLCKEDCRNWQVSVRIVLWTSDDSVHHFLLIFPDAAIKTSKNLLILSVDWCFINNSRNKQADLSIRFRENWAPLKSDEQNHREFTVKAEWIYWYVYSNTQTLPDYTMIRFSSRRITEYRKLLLLHPPSITPEKTSLICMLNCGNSRVLSRKTNHSISEKLSSVEGHVRRIVESSQCVDSCHVSSY